MLMPATIHPTSRTLVAYIDGELPVEERREVSEHLSACESCRSEADIIEADLDWFLVLDAASNPVEPQPAAAGLDDLISATREWAALHPSSAAKTGGSGDIAGRLADAAGLLFGPPIVNAEGEVTHSLLSAFLGRRAAQVLMNDIRRNSEEPFPTPGVS
jgi:anti-sigma factor RsiW